MTTTPVPTVQLRGKDGPVPMPQLGFGVWKVPNEEATPAVAAALRAGYRSIDTAALYANEAGVGRALADSDIPSAEIFLTTKVWNDKQGYDATLAAFDESIGKLGDVEPLDLYLIHWPAPQQDQFVDSFKALLHLRDEGRIRAAGVANFRVADLQRLHDELGEYPALNQIELHPMLAQRELREFHAQHDIATEAWSPLGQGGELLEDATIGAIADRYARTPAQVVLRWHLQLGNVVIPKSVTPARIVSNFDVFGFELDDLAMTAIAALDQGKRLGPDPSQFPG
ncbi:aldo/keto reductase [Leekyejoonella antrihumi]|nr:aldo/keto reductase [Leekyejoonella antrihumi]